jgi:polyketide synthase PksN
MESYGIDSVMVMELTTELERVFGPLSKTLFFEYQTIQALTAHLVAGHKDKLTLLLGVKSGDQVPAEPRVQEAAVAERISAPAAPSRRKGARFALQAPAHVGASVPPDHEDIAIIGISGRYPQAHDLATFWENLRSGKDSITEIPPERWDHSQYFDADPSKVGKTYSKWGGFIEGVDQFDPLFFNISPREAEFMDPQERLFLQCVYGALEDAGYTQQSLGTRREVGVYVGVMYEEYQLYGAQEQARGRALALSGVAASIANRVSYFLNLHGPSLALDTMCSSSLTAIHLACQSLQQDGCEAAIAGGVNLSIHPNKYLALAQGKFISSKGRCESFGQGGDGYVPGEGVGAILLKRKSKAIADGDHIYGIIKGSMVNAGGRTNGYSVPNPHAQAEVIKRAIKQAQIDPRTMSYIEAHGTGTALGDPIEITGLNKVFLEDTKAKQYCAIGSVKSNIGHCESAAGMAGVTKVLLQMQHGQLVPSLHSQRLNPNIDFANSAFVVQQELGEWRRPVVEIDGQAKEYPRRAGVSSFGAGGANAHVVLEEYVAPPRRQVPVTSANPALIVLSAKNEERLKARVQQLLDWMDQRELTPSELADIAYTLQVGRDAMEVRVAVVADTVEVLKAKLCAYLQGDSHIDELFRGEVKRNKDTMVLFAEDDDMTKAVDAWLAKGRYAKVLGLWVKGLTVDWRKLYGQHRPQRISLPTYPFAKERYWVPPVSGREAIAGQSAPHASPASLVNAQMTSEFDEKFFANLLRDLGNDSISVKVAVDRAHKKVMVEN